MFSTTHKQRAVGAVLLALLLLVSTVADAAMVGTRRALLSSGAPGWVKPGATIDMNFAGGQFYGRPLSGATVSRALEKTCETKALEVVTVPANTPCITDRGWLIEEGRTNSVQNNTYVGAVAGTPGTLPPGVTGWSINVAVQTSVAFATSNGMACGDIRFSGPGVVANAAINFVATSTTLASAQGQVWSHSGYFALVGGNLTNVSVLNIVLQPRDSGGATLTGATVTSMLGITSTLARYSVHNSATPPLTAAMHPRVLYTSTGAYDFTLRICGSQTELNPLVASSLASGVLATGGAGYTNGTQTLTASGGTCTIQPTISTTVTAGAVTAIGAVVAAGTCTVFPPSPVTLTGAGGAGATANLTTTNQAGQAFSTSMIKTSAGTLLRPADAALVSPGFTPPAGMTLFAQAAPLAPTANTTNQRTLQVDDGGAPAAVLIFRSASSGAVRGNTVSGGVNAAIGAAAWPQNTAVKIAYATAQTDQSVVVSGGAPTTGATNYTPVGAFIRIGKSLGTTDYFNGYVERIAIAYSRIPNQVMINRWTCANC